MTLPNLYKQQINYTLAQFAEGIRQVKSAVELGLPAALLLAFFALAVVGFCYGAWPFDGRTRQYKGAIFVSGLLTLLLALIIF